VDESQEHWGTFDRDKLEVTLHNKEQTCDEDLLDLALTNTIVHKGRAFVLKKDELPGGFSISAILRQ
jgi:hypothetical protein